MILLQLCLHRMTLKSLLVQIDHDQAAWGRPNLHDRSEPACTAQQLIQTSPVVRLTSVLLAKGHIFGAACRTSIAAHQERHVMHVLHAADYSDNSMAKLASVVERVFCWFLPQPQWIAFMIVMVQAKHFIGQEY